MSAPASEVENPFARRILTQPSVVEVVARAHDRVELLVRREVAVALGVRLIEAPQLVVELGFLDFACFGFRGHPGATLDDTVPTAYRFLNPRCGPRATSSSDGAEYVPIPSCTAPSAGRRPYNTRFTRALACIELGMRW